MPESTPHRGSDDRRIGGVGGGGDYNFVLQVDADGDMCDPGGLAIDFGTSSPLVCTYNGTDRHASFLQVSDGMSRLSALAIALDADLEGGDLLSDEVLEDYWQSDLEPTAEQIAAVRTGVRWVPADPRDADTDPRLTATGLDECLCAPNLPLSQDQFIQLECGADATTDRVESELDARSAQSVADRALGDAQRKAEQIVSDAQRKAERIVREARVESERLMLEAKTDAEQTAVRAKRQVRELTSQRDAITSQLGQLRELLAGLVGGGAAAATVAKAAAEAKGVSEEEIEQAEMAAGGVSLPGFL
jgi:vacuolar-type H+-ATPase subunit H